MTVTEALFIVGILLSWSIGFACCWLLNEFMDEADRRRRKKYESYLGTVSDDEWKRLTS